MGTKSSGLLSWVWPVARVKPPESPQISQNELRELGYYILMDTPKPSTDNCQKSREGGVCEGSVAQICRKLYAKLLVFRFVHQTEEGCEKLSQI